jgi:hypothetical protein
MRIYIYLTIILMGLAATVLAKQGEKMSPLDKALQSVQSDQSQAKAFYTLFLNTDLYIPVNDSSQNENAERRASENETFSPIIIVREGIKYLPVFDSKERLQNWAKREVKFIRLPAHGLLHNLDSSIHLVLNLGTKHFKEFVIGEVKMLQETVRSTKPQIQKAPAGTQVLIGVPAKLPEGLKEALLVCLSRNKEVSAAYLGQILMTGKDEKPHLILVVQTDLIPENTFAAIAQEIGLIAKNILPPDEYIDIVRDTGSGLSAKIIERVQPIYTKSR